MPRARLVLTRSTSISGPPERLEGERTLAPGDARVLGELLHAAYRGTVDDEGESVEDAVGEAGRTLDGAYGPVLWACSRIVVGEAEGVGLAAAVVTHAPELGALLAFSVTRPEVQRRGFAAALIQRALSEAHALGHERLSLVVTEANTPALALYRKLGFAGR
jgi:ribosomal protein S18 acetylase RimI-like enzyme